MAFINIGNTNLENGITNRKDSDLFGSMGMLDPTKFITHWDDFIKFPTFVDGTGNYTGPQTGSISSNVILGGGIVVTTGTNAGDANIVKVQGKGFIINLGSRMYFRAAANFTDIFNTFSVSGLTSSSSPATIPPISGIFFQSLDTSNTLDLVIYSNSTQVAIASNIITLNDSESFTTEFFWDGISRFYYGVNGNTLGFIELTELMLPMSLMSPFMGLVSGISGGSKILFFDYIFTNQERD